jgi:putative RecB family exonuclease
MTDVRDEQAAEVLAALARPPHEWVLPKALSPSRAAEYEQCARKFFFKAITKLPDPAGAAAARGTLVHDILERLFDLPLGERHLPWCLDEIDPTWAKMLADGGYAHLAGDAETIRAEATTMLTNYFTMENPNKFTPHARELRLFTRFGEANVVGVIDRVDRVEAGEEVRWYISDFKTSKPKSGRYLDEAFNQLRVYAAMLEAELGVEVYQLRLVYLGGKGREAVRAVNVDRTVTARSKARMERVWLDIRTSAETGSWPTRTGPLCNWCPFQVICPEFSALPVGPIPEPFDPDRSGERAPVDPAAGSNTPAP